MTVDPRDLTLYDAERWLVGACIDHELALLVALDRLPLHPFRSHRAQELERLFYTVAGWFDLGKFDGMKNRERLGLLFKECNLAEEEAWCPWGVVPEFVEALCDALTLTVELERTAIEANRQLHEDYPLSCGTWCEEHNPTAPAEGVESFVNSRWANPGDTSTSR